MRHANRQEHRSTSSRGDAMQMQGGHTAHTRERVGAMGFLGPARIINGSLSAQCGFVIPAPRRECASVQAEQDKSFKDNQELKKHLMDIANLL